MYKYDPCSSQIRPLFVRAPTNGVFAESYAYDPLGRRTSTTSLSATNHEPSTIFHAYDGDRCVAEIDASGRPLRAYSWGPGTDTLHALTVYPAGTGATNVFYAACDAQGSVGFLATSGGGTAECCEYDAWGCTAISGANYSGRRSASAYGNRFMFHGGAYSAATGLYQFRARWYSPELGRWLSPDPIGLEGGLNLYEFCRNAPVNFRDPYGEDIADYNWDWLYNTSDFAAGFGDNISGGLTSLLRDTLYDDPTDKCSGWYRGGDYAGYVYDAATLARMAAEMAAARAARVAQLAMERQALAAAREAELAAQQAAKNASKVFSKEKQALVDMAKADARTGMTKADMEAYKQLNKELSDPFPANKVRGPEAHPSRSPHSQEPHGHVGPVDHIPITDVAL